MPEYIGRLDGVISSDRSPRCQSCEMASAISRSTPRVRCNLSSVDQSPESRSNGAGWIGYDYSIRFR